MKLLEIYVFMPDFDITKQPDIIQAAQRGDLAAVQAIVSANPDSVHTEATNGSRVLAFAAQEGHEAIFDFLIAHGADVHAINQLAQCALSFSIMGQRISIAKKILQQVALKGNSQLQPYVEKNNPPSDMLLLARKIIVKVKEFFVLGSVNIMDDLVATGEFNSVSLSYARHPMSWVKEVQNERVKYTLQFESGYSDFLKQNDGEDLVKTIRNIAAINVGSYLSLAGNCGEKAAMAIHFLVQLKIEGLKIFLIVFKWPCKKDPHVLLMIEYRDEKIFIDPWAQICFSSHENVQEGLKKIAEAMLRQMIDASHYEKTQNEKDLILKNFEDEIADLSKLDGIFGTYAINERNNVVIGDQLCKEYQTIYDSLFEAELKKHHLRPPADHPYHKVIQEIPSARQRFFSRSKPIDDVSMTPRSLGGDQMDLKITPRPSGGDQMDLKMTPRSSGGDQIDVSMTPRSFGGGQP